MFLQKKTSIILCVFVFGLWLHPFKGHSQNLSEATDMLYFAKSFTANYDSLLQSYYFRQNGLSLKRYKLGEPASPRIDFESVTDSVIYHRLLSLNTKVPLPYKPIVRGYVSMYLRKMNHGIDIMLSQSHYYFPMFEEVLDKYKVPEELEYLAIIESALNPNAVSKAGATGLWQFMHQTGKNYGLEINTFVDERRDPYKSTVAAAQFLRDLHSIYNDWTLAIAAYNCGPGNVNKAIARSGGKTFWDIYDYLPRETRGYIPAYIAAVYMMKFHEKHGLKPSVIKTPNPTKPDSIMVYRDVDFASVTKYVGISMEELRVLNPQYKLSFIPQSEKGYPLYLPHSKLSTFIKYQDSIYSYSRDSLLNTAVKEWRSVKTITHVVRRNETISKVASQYGVSTANLRQWNHLSKKSKLRAGQRLIIYKKTVTTTVADTTRNTATNAPAPTFNDTLTADNTNTVSTTTANNDSATPKTSNSQTSTSQTEKTADITPSTKETVEPSETSNKKTDLTTTTKKKNTEPTTIKHTVKQGDNLFRIAQKYNTTVDKIKKDNNLKNDNIQIGKTLIIKK